MEKQEAKEGPTTNSGREESCDIRYNHCKIFGHIKMGNCEQISPGFTKRQSRPMWCMLPDNKGTTQQESLFSSIPTAITQGVFYLQEHSCMSYTLWMSRRGKLNNNVLLVHRSLWGTQLPHYPSVGVQRYNSLDVLCGCRLDLHQWPGAAGHGQI